MKNGIGRINQRAVILVAKAKAIAGEVAPENTHARVYIFEKLGKLKMELQRLPEPLARFLLGFRAHQEIQPVPMAGEEPRRKVAAEISSGTCQENSHRRMPGALANRRRCSFLRWRRPVKRARLASFQRPPLH